MGSRPDRRTPSRDPVLLHRGPEEVEPAVDDVVAERQQHRVVADELIADEDRLGDSPGHCLLGVLDPDAPLLARAEELLVAGQVFGGGDDEHVPDPPSIRVVSG